jgi:hypothetical protein
MGLEDILEFVRQRERSVEFFGDHCNSALPTAGLGIVGIDIRSDMVVPEGL